MIYKRNLVIYIGLVISLFGIALYDPLGVIYKGAGLMVLGIGLICLFFGYRQINEAEIVNKAVESFEKNRRRLW